jgi:hypothetical protein
MLILFELPSRGLCKRVLDEANRVAGPDRLVSVPNELQTTV